MHYIRTVRANGHEHHAVAEVASGVAFSRALCKHFGLSPYHVYDVKVNTDESALFSATVTIGVTPQDLAAIAKLMAEPEPVVRWPGQPEPNP